MGFKDIVITIRRSGFTHLSHYTPGFESVLEIAILRNKHQFRLGFTQLLSNEWVMHRRESVVRSAHIITWSALAIRSGFLARIEQITPGVVLFMRESQHMAKLVQDRIIPTRICRVKVIIARVTEFHFHWRTALKVPYVSRTSTFGISGNLNGNDIITHVI